MAKWDGRDIAEVMRQSGLDWAQIGADKIEGLEEDLKSALEKVWRYGPKTWVKMNYPSLADEFERQEIPLNTAVRQRAENPQ